MKNIVVIYHKDCPDGFGAAWAAWRKFGKKADYIAAEYKNPPLLGFKNKEIYFLDFGYDKKVMAKILRQNKRIVFIDHHITRKDVLPILSEYFFDISHSGAVLAWKYFHPGKPVPKLLLYIEDEDLGKLKLPLTKELGLSLSIFDYEFALWNKIASEFENPKKRWEYSEKGKLISKFTDKIIELIVRDGEEVLFENRKALAVNSPVLGSEIGRYIVRKKGFPIGIVWSKKNDGIRFQLRSGKSVDVSKLAQKYGGGGHKQAAGFYLKGKIRFPWKNV